MKRRNKHTFGAIINGDREESNRRTFTVEKQFQINMLLVLFTNDGYSFRFNCHRELIPDYWRNYRESMFASMQLRFRNTLDGSG